jgi:hypothetical protein
MKSYPTIEYYGENWGIPVIAFDKLDGSNLRFEYSHKRGVYKAGTRNMMIDRTHETFGFAVDIFREKYEEGIRKVLREKPYRDILSFVFFNYRLVQSMKSYPTIEYYGENWGIPVIAFDKLDGSNLRFEYSHKRGVYKAGTRNMMIDRTHETFGFAVDIFREKYEEGIRKVLREKPYRDILSFVFFAELLGTRSEFGQHDFANDQFDVVLFDVSLYKKGMLFPKEFVRDFSHLGIPRVVYEGNLTRDFVQRVKANEFDLSEGVICKGKTETRKGVDMPYYCKVKTDEWLNRLKNKRPDLYIEEEKQIHSQ